MHSKLVTGIIYKEKRMREGFTYKSRHLDNHERQVALTKQLTECYKGKELGNLFSMVSSRGSFVLPYVDRH